MTRRASVPYALAALFVLAAIAWLLFIGREPICKCGFIKLWHGQTVSSENSQHLTDWYTPSHLLHGILFFWALSSFRRIPLGWRFLMAAVVETIWEVVENSTWIIERYRAVTISLDYYGDSVINSTFDILAMAVGFFLARRLPVWVCVALVVGFEVLTTWLIRDGLTLNIIMLIHPFDAIREWQTAG